MEIHRFAARRRDYAGRAITGPLTPVVSRFVRERLSRHRSLQPVRYGDSDISLASGRLRVRRWGAADAPAVVCVPGLSANLCGFDRLAERLAGDTLQLVAIDLRGRGRSEVTGLTPRAKSPRRSPRVADLSGAVGAVARDLARRRCLAAGPANRLVADTLEADWLGRSSDPAIQGSGRCEQYEVPGGGDAGEVDDELEG